MVLVFDYMGHEVSLFKKGRMLIKNVHDEASAEKVAHAIIDLINAQ